MSTGFGNVSTLQLAGTGTTTINWEDGEALEMVTLTSTETPFIHNYIGTSAHNIAIYGQNITGLHCTKMQLTSLDVTNNTALTILGCFGNWLTTTDMAKNTVLTDLICVDNYLTVEGLNTLFGTLHSNTGDKTIRVSGNPYTDDCDQSICGYVIS